VPKNLARLDAYELDPKKEFGMKYSVVRDPMPSTSSAAAFTHDHRPLRAGRVPPTQKPFTEEIVMWPCISCGFGERCAMRGFR